MALQVRQCAAHAYEVVDQHVFAPWLYRPGELGLASQPRETIRPRVSHHVDLRHAQVVRPTDSFADLHRKRLGNSVDAFALVRMGAHQRGRVTSQQIDKLLILQLTHRVIDHDSSRRAMPRLGPLVSGMLLHRRLVGVDQHVREVAPCGTRRFDVLGHWPHFPTPTPF